MTNIIDGPWNKPQTETDEKKPTSQHEFMICGTTKVVSRWRKQHEFNLMIAVMETLSYRQAVNVVAEISQSPLRAWRRGCWSSRPFSVILHAVLWRVWTIFGHV